jgi:hypothetical protein
VSRADQLNALADLVREHYVFAAEAETIADSIIASDFASSAAADEEFAALVTDSLQTLNGDKHLRLKWHPDGLVDPASEDDWLADYTQRAVDNSYGIGDISWLDDDIAVIPLEPELFHPMIAGDAQTTAMRAVAEARGLVLDLRNCRGGAPQTTALIATYLIGPDEHLSDLVTRDPAFLEQIWTMPWVPGSSVGAEVPVAILTSTTTFSGAEDLAYTLQAKDRAIVVGETSGGGAHPRRGFRITDNLEATIPVARTINKVTGTNWEGVGVVPDVAVTTDGALEAAVRELRERSS